MECDNPADICIIFFSVGINTGVFCNIKIDGFPNCPTVFNPQEKTLPKLFNNNKCDVPNDDCMIFVIVGRKVG
jgi:hypothetical protein